MLCITSEHLWHNLKQVIKSYILLNNVLVEHLRRWPQRETPNNFCWKIDRPRRFQRFKQGWASLPNKRLDKRSNKWEQARNALLELIDWLIELIALIELIELVELIDWMNWLNELIDWIDWLHWLTQWIVHWMDCLDWLIESFDWIY